MRQIDRPGSRPPLSVPVWMHPHIDASIKNRTQKWEAKWDRLGEKSPLEWTSEMG